MFFLHLHLSKLVLYSWQTPKYHTLTDKMLTLLEEDSGLRCGLGYDPQGETKVVGVSKMDLQRKIARKVILDCKEFASMPLNKAADAVKNRLKK